MNEQPVILSVLDLDVAFKAGADMERVKMAVGMIEERYADQKARARGSQSKDVILTMVALGLADELIQLTTKQDADMMRLRDLIAKIEKSL